MLKSTFVHITYESLIGEMYEKKEFKELEFEEVSILQSRQISLVIFLCVIFVD